MQEEVSLYRNGTTGEDFVEIIKEKDAELAATKQNLAEKTESLRKLAKTSAGVLAECDRLNDTTRTLQAEKKDLEEKLSAQSMDLENTRKQLTEAQEALGDVESELSHLRQKYTFTVEDIDKLQQR